MRGSRWARRSGGRGGNGKTALRRGARPREPSTCSNTGPLMQFHTLEYYIVHVDVAVVRNGKREKVAHPVKTFCVLLFPIATSEIIHLLQFKLFLTIFNCIYVSFFYINYLQI